MNLYVDDVRTPPLGWSVARTVEDAKRLLVPPQMVERLSLDHDMGCCQACYDGETGELHSVGWCPHVPDGTHLVRWMVETGNWPKLKPTVHSANRDGAARMQGLIDRFFGQPAQGPMF